MIASSLRLLALVAALALAVPAAAQTALLPGFPDLPLRGPTAAKGAVIWSHGKARLGDLSGSPIDGYTTVLREAGWDVFRLNRKGMGDNQYDSTVALGEAVDKLHHDGYGKVVLAGQSFGAWTSFLVGAKHDDLHAIIATAPAAFGTWDQSVNRYDNNALYLYDMVERIKPTRVMVFFFASDDFDPGGRGPALTRILKERNIPYKLIDQPPDLAGHGAAHSRLFAGRYGKCMIDFIDPAKPPDAAPCATSWGREPTGEVPLPPDLNVTSPGPAVPPALAALSGRWWGWYPNGREVEIVVTSITAGEAKLVYAVGPGDVGSKAEYALRSATLGEGRILSVKPNSATLILRPQGTGRASLTWKSANGASSLVTEVSRID